MKSEEGTIRLENGFNIWYRRLGEGSGTPLLVLHGGPGAGHDYLEPLGRLAESRPVVFYDQLGCGKSDRVDDIGLWKIERFVREVNEVRAALRLESIHLLGQSWGGWLSIEYMLSQPTGVERLVLASTSASMPQFAAETRRLRTELPADVQATLDRYEALGDYNHPKYEEAAMVFYRKHVCRLPEWPDYVMRTLANLEGNPVYETMNGPNEFTTIGNLQGWDRTDRLGEIRIPTLITVGRYDELTPACAETLKGGIPDSRLVVFEDSSHLAHVEEESLYLQVLREFLGESQ
jgi:proline-specific peptidase